jgi:peptidoglycan/LPS O-acetylase OafA/YrhL
VLFCYYVFQIDMAASPQAISSDPNVAVLERTEEKDLSDVPFINSSVRIPALDGLRGIAILLVLLHHAVFRVQSSSKLLMNVLAPGRLAWSGVDLFFVLSGFLIGGILLDARQSPRFFKTFYIRRAYRILPLYAALLTLYSVRYIPWQGILGPLRSLSESPIPWLSYASFTQNIWMAWLGTFGIITMTVTWSLAVEEQFYLTVPFVIHKIGNSRLILVLLSVLLGAPLLRTSLHLFFRNGNFAAYVLMPCRADALCLGVLVALLVRMPRTWKSLVSRRSAICWATGFLFVGLAAVASKGHEFSTPMVTIGYSALALFYTGCLLITVTAQSGRLVRTLCNPLLMQLGVLAYCTYLIHVPVIEVCRRILGLRFTYASETTQFVGGLIGVILTLVVAKFSWHFFERPFLRRGHTYQY